MTEFGTEDAGIVGDRREFKIPRHTTETATKSSLKRGFVFIET